MDLNEMEVVDDLFVESSKNPAVKDRRREVKNLRSIGIDHAHEDGKALREINHDLKTKRIDIFDDDDDVLDAKDNIKNKSKNIKIKDKSLDKDIDIEFTSKEDEKNGYDPFEGKSINITPDDLKSKHFKTTFGHEKAHAIQDAKGVYTGNYKDRRHYPIEDTDDYIAKCAKIFIMANGDKLSDHDHLWTELHADGISGLENGFGKQIKSRYRYLKTTKDDGEDESKLNESNTYRIKFLEDMKHIHEGHPNRCSMRYPPMTNEDKKFMKEYSVLISNEEFFKESKLSTKERDDLKDSEFGIPEDRAFPLNDESHVRNALSQFSHVPESKRKDVAKRIIKRAHELNMDTTDWEINKYIKESYFYENDDTERNVLEMSKLNSFDNLQKERDEVIKMRDSKMDEFNQLTSSIAAIAEKNKSGNASEEDLKKQSSLRSRVNSILKEIKEFSKKIDSLSENIVFCFNESYESCEPEEYEEDYLFTKILEAYCDESITLEEATEEIDKWNKVRERARIRANMAKNWDENYYRNLCDVAYDYKNYDIPRERRLELLELAKSLSTLRPMHFKTPKEMDEYRRYWRNDEEHREAVDKLYKIGTAYAKRVIDSDKELNGTKDDFTTDTKDTKDTKVVQELDVELQKMDEMVNKGWDDGYFKRVEKLAFDKSLSEKDQKKYWELYHNLKSLRPLHMVTPKEYNDVKSMLPKSRADEMMDWDNYQRDQYAKRITKLAAEDRAESNKGDVKKEYATNNDKKNHIMEAVGMGILTEEEGKQLIGRVNYQTQKDYESTNLEDMDVD